MKFETPLIPARLIKRYKRFLADMRLENGDEITAHCANPGSMIGLNMPGALAYLSKSSNPKRKLAYSWELVEVDMGTGPALVGINTSWPNKLVEEAILAGQVSELSGYETLRREVKYGKNSRVDILMRSDGKPDCYVEVKNVHLVRRAGLAEFPDSVTSRGAKHLEELGDMVEAGHRALMVYLVQHPLSDRFTLARDIDPNYGAAFDRAKARGVEATVLFCDVSCQEIKVVRTIPMVE